MLFPLVLLLASQDLTANAVKSAPSAKMLKTVSQGTGPATVLKFQDFYETKNGTLDFSDKLRSLNGKHVRITGFMAHMEDAPLGAFYVCPHPTFCDEEGGGSADLPPDAVRVIVRGAKGRTVEFVPRPVLVTGVLQVGPQEDEKGDISRIRIILDQAPVKPSPVLAKSNHK
ncbi:hypothetical protein CCAX7_27530 [Capsulimonas corticalis]|uniref:Uncharacterized protein n=1 Tax=Capsulimonas corticalis TaxID=2219043 RepID=A0A402CTL4_9BACT|nr:hypothetical protein [Capsulimonas corticalis]BDI30702.1 hypothetical protein CCAX7_27530 [Capsulimonas corticalis]